MFCTKKINGVEIAYDESGFSEGPAIVLLTGWAHDMSLYDELLPYLAQNHWVIRVNWRGHGLSRDKIDDFGVEEQVDDTLALLGLLEVDQCLLVSHSHGGWAGLALADKMGKGRVKGLLMIDQIMTPPPPEFAACLQSMQSKATWRGSRRALFDDWIAHSQNKPLHDHIRYSLSSFGYDMWSLSCRVIASAYETWGTPMGRMSKITQPPLIRHVFSHPLDRPDYRQLHEDFGKQHPWFSYTDLRGETHFPSLEIPEKVAQEIEDLLSKSD